MDNHFPSHRDPSKYDEFVWQLLEKAEEERISGNNDSALKTLEAVLVNEPKCFEALEEIGDNYMTIRKFFRAEKALRQAVKINPTSSNAHYLLGFLYSTQQRWTESVDELVKADEFFPNHPEILRCLGWSYYNHNRKSSQGIAILERSKNLSPNDPNILCDLGVCYMNSQDFRKSVHCFERILKIAPTSEQAKEAQSFLEILKKSIPQKNEDQQES